MELKQFSYVEQTKNRLLEEFRCKWTECHIYIYIYRITWLFVVALNCDVVAFSITLILRFEWHFDTNQYWHSYAASRDSSVVCSNGAFSTRRFGKENLVNEMNYSSLRPVDRVRYGMLRQYLLWSSVCCQSGNICDHCALFQSNSKIYMSQEWYSVAWIDDSVKHFGINGWIVLEICHFSTAVKLVFFI